MNEVESSEVELSEVEQQQLIAKVKEMIETQVGMPLVQMTKQDWMEGWTPYAIMSPTGKILFTVGIGIGTGERRTQGRKGEVYLNLANQVGRYVWGGVYDWLDDICHEIQKLNRNRWLRKHAPQPVLAETAE